MLCPTSLPLEELDMSILDFISWICWGINPLC
jgi:hypothetical protein